jgi:hypothetical protein
MYPFSFASERIFREDFSSILAMAQNSGVKTGTAAMNGSLDCDGSSVSVAYKHVGTVKTVKIILESATTTEDILDLDGGTHTIEVGSGTITATNFSSAVIYVDGVVSSTLDTDEHTVVVTTDTEILATALTIGLVGASYFDGTIKRVELFSETWTAQEVLDDYNKTVYSPIEATKSLIFLPGRARFTDSGQELTKNLGSEGNLICGDGSTATTFPTFSVPKIMTFDGGDYLETSAAADLAATDSLVFHCRFSTTSNNQYIMDWRSAATNDAGTRILMDSSGRLLITTYDGSGNSVTTTDSFNDGAFHHLVATWNNIDASNVQATVYVDGFSEVTGSLAVPVADSGTIIIGDWVSKNLGFTGTMEEVGLFKTTGTPTQVRWLYQKSLKEVNV